MVPILALWLPILAAAVIVFVVSSLLHMVLTYHQSDYRGLPHEADVMEAMRKAGVQPGDYMMPHGGSMAAFKDPVFLDKYAKGPVAVLTVMRSGRPSMGPQLAPAPTTSPCSASPARRPSSATRWRCGRTRSGTRSSSVRRSRTRSTASSTAC